MFMPHTDFVSQDRFCTFIIIPMAPTQSTQETHILRPNKNQSSTDIVIAPGHPESIKSMYSIFRGDTFQNVKLPV